MVICDAAQDTGLLNKIRAVKAIVIEPRASDKENFDEVMRQFYNVIKNCHVNDNGNGARCCSLKDYWLNDIVPLLNRSYSLLYL